ncbi:P-loop containing nucleoside triphosphate hydrolase protein [Coprinopsis sp. MPI-PUGE-AT-0042]|nr:P-loop containing nucleoside triphosphate hydrolase protein [Coprinopsis sp. MPI-PUGE-AT-0042]
MRKLGITDQEYHHPFTGQDDDIIILVMGSTGAGKSTFINKYIGNGAAAVGHQLQSCTRDVTWYLAAVPPTLAQNFPSLKNRRLIMVETPGFDDAFLDGSEILKRISVWLAQSYNERGFISGIIYMSDISQQLTSAAMRLNRNMFTKLCGTSLERVALATSKWDNLPNEVIGEHRERELSAEFWKPLLDIGAQLFSVKQPQDREVIMDYLIHALHENEDKKWVLRIQKEIVDSEKNISRTRAGKELKYSLEQLLTYQKEVQANTLDERGKQELDAKMARAKKQLKALKVPFSE